VSQAADGLASVSARLDEARRTKSGQVPAHKGLRQADVLDQVRDARFPLGQAAHDPQAVHIREGPVHDLELAQVVRLVDDRGQRRTNSSGGGAQGTPPRRRINGGLYQRPLMLLPLSGHVNREHRVRTLRR
jgi:hypothetical protein